MATPKLLPQAFLYPSCEGPLEPVIQKVLEGAGFALKQSSPGVWVGEDTPRRGRYHAVRLTAVQLEAGILTEVTVERRLTPLLALLALVLFVSVIGILPLIVASRRSSEQVEDMRLALYHRVLEQLHGALGAPKLPHEAQAQPA